jgi:hypothetical protein
MVGTAFPVGGGLLLNLFLPKMFWKMGGKMEENGAKKKGQPRKGQEKMYR